MDTLMMIVISLALVVPLYWVNNPWQIKRRYYWRSLCARCRFVVTVPLPRGWSLKLCGPETVVTAAEGEVQ